MEHHFNIGLGLESTSFITVFSTAVELQSSTGVHLPPQGAEGGIHRGVQTK